MVRQTNNHIQAYKHAQCVFFLSEAETKAGLPITLSAIDDDEGDNEPGTTVTVTSATTIATKWKESFPYKKLNTSTITPVPMY